MQTEQEIYDQLMSEGPSIANSTTIEHIKDIIYDGMPIKDAIDTLQVLRAEYGDSLVFEVECDYYDGYEFRILRHGYETPKEQKARCKRQAAQIYADAKAKEDKKLAKQQKAEAKERELYEKLKAKFDS